MSCHHVEELLPRYLENDLSEDDRSMVEAHLASCAQCRASLETFAALDESLVRLKTVVPSWKTTEARFAGTFGFKERRPFVSLVFNAPVLLGLLFIAFGIVLHIRGRLILSSLDALVPRMTNALAFFGEPLSRLFAAAAGMNIIALLSIYGVLTLVLLYAGGHLVLNFGRK